MGADSPEVAITQVLEQLATASAMCFFNTVSHLLVTNPTSSVLEDVPQHYLEIFPAQINFHGPQSYHTVNAARCLLIRWRGRRSFFWSVVAHNLAKVARFRYQSTQRAKVPRLILRFALHSLSLDPPPSISIATDSLSIIAIDLVCDMSDIRTTTLDER